VIVSHLPDPHPSGLERQRRQYRDAVATLADPALTSLVLVARAETSALSEATRASHELGRLGVDNQQLVMNGMLRNSGSNPTARAFTERQQLALAHAPAALQQLPDPSRRPRRRRHHRHPRTQAAHQRHAGHTDVSPESSAPIAFDELETLIDELDADGPGVVLTIGKRGVGKTTIAAAIAVALADRGRQVTLLDRLLPFLAGNQRADWALCESNHAGVRSPAFTPGPCQPSSRSASPPYALHRLRGHDARRGNDLRAAG
jgi:hypothetical protein